MRGPGAPHVLRQGYDVWQDGLCLGAPAHARAVRGALGIGTSSAKTTTNINDNCVRLRRTMVPQRIGMGIAGQDSPLMISRLPVTFNQYISLILDPYPQHVAPGQAHSSLESLSCP